MKSLAQPKDENKKAGTSACPFQPSNLQHSDAECTCRPVPDSEAGDAELSLLSYLDRFENSFLEYKKRVEGADFARTFGYLVMHTPFGGMVKGAHRDMMRKMVMANPKEIEADFGRRLFPGLIYCQRVGNILGATTMLSLLSAIDHGDFRTP